MANPAVVQTAATTGKAKRKAPLGPKVSKFIVLYENKDGKTVFEGLYRGMSAEAFEAMSRANSAGRRLESHTFEIKSKPGVKNDED